MATNNIHYIFDSDRDTELIFCENSTISYPTHNHVSTLTIGIVLDGSILLATNHDVKTYEKNQHSDNQNPFIDNWKKNLELHPEKKMSVDEMAQDSFISKYHFIRSFKAEVGLTPHQFQLQNRIRKAQRLMHSSETITEIALATGFCDQSHFIKQFKKQVGLTPLAYKLSSRIIKTGESNQHNAGINFANR